MNIVRSYLSRRSQSTLLVLLSLLGPMSCGKDPASPEPQAPSGVTVESARRQSATIGVAGGSVSATSSTGVTYTLEIPDYALAGDVEIAIAPVTAIANMPFTAAFEGAVQLEPSGLRLFKPARLTIGKAPIAGAERLVGFAYEGDADSILPAGATAGASEIVVLVSHFSGAGAASGSEDEISAWLAEFCSGYSLDYPFGPQIRSCYPGTPADHREWFLEYALNYLQSVITPMIQNGDPSDAVAEYVEWYWGCDAAAEAHNATDWATVLDPQISTAIDLMAQRLITALADTKAQLCAQGGVERLRTIMEYRHLANAAGLEENVGLRDDDIFQGLCAEVDIVDTALVDPLPVGDDRSIDLRAELKINGQREDANFKIVINPINATCGAGLGACGGRANGLGEYSQVVRRSSQDPVQIQVFAFLMMSLFDPGSGGGFALTETPLFGAEVVNRDGWTISESLPAIVTPGVPAELAVTVTRWAYGGGSSGWENALVAFTVTGGTADPISATTDVSGLATTQVTADPSTGAVQVEARVYWSGEELGSVTVYRGTGGGVPALTFLSRLSGAYANAGKLLGSDSYCPPSQTADESSSMSEAPFGFNHARSYQCPNPNTGTLTASASASGRSDPGFLTGESDALIEFDVSLNGSASGRTGVVMTAVAAHSFDLQFRLDGDSLPFRLEVVTGGNDTQNKLNTSLSREGADLVFVFDRTPTDPNLILTGTLPPGIYQFHAIRYLTVSSDASATASASGFVQLRLGSP